MATTKEMIMTGIKEMASDFRNYLDLKEISKFLNEVKKPLKEVFEESQKISFLKIKEEKEKKGAEFIKTKEVGDLLKGVTANGSYIFRISKISEKTVSGTVQVFDEETKSWVDKISDAGKPISCWRYFSAIEEYSEKDIPTEDIPTEESDE
jgi:C1A family cysteine protease